MQTLCELESLPGVSIDETVDGFEIKGLGYELDVRESPAGYTYKDKNVEITMQKMTRAIVCYELLNDSAEQQLELLRNSDTGVAKELLLKLPEGKSALAFTEDLSDTIKLVEEQIKYKIK
jgi:hypothetical protein